MTLSPPPDLLLFHPLLTLSVCPPLPLARYSTVQTRLCSSRSASTHLQLTSHLPSPGLVLRARGHCGPVQELCGSLDSRLSTLLTDVRHYTERPESGRPGTAELTTSPAGPAAPPPFEPWADSGQLADTLREETRTQLDRWGLMIEVIV